jgi:CRP-like cAMP-binding protein
MNFEIPLWAAFFGFVAAAALPLGTVTIKFWKPSEKILAFLLAFGSGALLAATLDLVSETPDNDFLYLAIGCVAGGVLFVGINAIINSKGGFLRKKSTAVNYLRKQKLEQYKHIFEELSKVHLFQSLPPAEVQSIIPYIFNRHYSKGDVIFKQGDPGDSFYMIDEGEIEIFDDRNNLKIATLKENDVLGEMAIVTGETRSASAIASSEDVKVWIILKEHFDVYLITKPVIAEAVNAIISERVSDLKDKKAIDSSVAFNWVKQATKNIDSKVSLPTEHDLNEAHSEHAGSGIAIWLGNLFDCIPGALIIGATMHSVSGAQHFEPFAAVKISLIAGLFLANYPESLSSSADMQQHGSSFSKVFWMWTSLFIISGLCAFLGNRFFIHMEVTMKALMEGIAAGAMLTMIADTMLPEAYYKFSSITGLSTLLGFLVAIFISTF